MFWMRNLRRQFMSMSVIIPQLDDCGSAALNLAQDEAVGHGAASNLELARLYGQGRDEIMKRLNEIYSQDRGLEDDQGREWGSEWYETYMVFVLSLSDVDKRAFSCFTTLLDDVLTPQATMLPAHKDDVIAGAMCELMSDLECDLGRVETDYDMDAHEAWADFVCGEILDAVESTERQWGQWMTADVAGKAVATLDHWLGGSTVERVNAIARAMGDMLDSLDQRMK